MSRSLLLYASIFAAAGLACSYGGVTGIGAAGSGEHRAQAVACKVTYPSGTAMTCDSSADCSADGGSPNGLCLGHVCNFDDKCLVDADCPNGGVCVCSRGLSLLFNLCVPATCRIDADCGTDGLCSPGSSYCGNAQSYRCRSAADSVATTTCSG